MTLPVYFNSKKTSNLFGLKGNFEFLKNLYIKNKLPRAFMLSGKKGSGKSTLVNHFLHFCFDKENYNEEANEFNHVSAFNNQFLNNIYSNIIYLLGSDFKNISVEDIRNLKRKIYQTSISDMPRFIILDDVELFNNNSLNALLKMIEEPTKNNYFFLINNKNKPLIETVKSRCLEVKIFLKNIDRIDIVNSLIKKFQIDPVINFENSDLTPGQFIKFNYIFIQNKISLNEDFSENLPIFLNLYKKNKDKMYIDMILFLADSHFNGLIENNLSSKDEIIKNKNYVFENINKFFLYNVNQNALLNSINNKI